MGPRSHERGNIDPQGMLGAVDETCFNGAAFSRTRKRSGSSVVRRIRVMHYASMGPRSHERGNVIRLVAEALSRRT